MQKVNPTQTEGEISETASSSLQFTTALFTEMASGTVASDNHPADQVRRPLGLRALQYIFAVSLDIVDGLLVLFLYGVGYTYILLKLSDTENVKAYVFISRS